MQKGVVLKHRFVFMCAFEVKEKAGVFLSLGVRVGGWCVVSVGLIKAQENKKSDSFRWVI